MSDILGKLADWVDKKLGTQLPPQASMRTGPAVFRLVKGDGVTSTPGATSRPNVNADALRGKDTDIPEASTELFKLSAEIARGNKR
ncbi:MAG: hypothetical protein ABSE93_24250 [Terriglobia bacterium]|jgi:hypothetical protein